MQQTLTVDRRPRRLSGAADFLAATRQVVVNPRCSRFYDPGHASCTEWGMAPQTANRRESDRVPMGVESALPGFQSPPRSSRSKRRAAACASSSSLFWHWSGRDSRRTEAPGTQEIRAPSSPPSCGSGGFGKAARLERAVRSASLRFQRAQVRGDRQHIFDAQLGDHRFHQLREGTGAVAALHIVSWRTT